MLIKQLDDQTVKTLNAGVIFKNPINVVKELVENSLDAHARLIKVSLIQGGYSQIKVADNGDGIYVDAADQLCKRFCTSKLRHIDDLATLTTFGFRGEALAALSYVASLEITSKPLFNTDISSAAWTAEYSDGVMKSLNRTNNSEENGTTVLVMDLFKRNNALRITMADRVAQQSEIAEYISQMSLYYCGCGFILDDDSEILVNTRPSGLTGVTAPMRPDADHRVKLKTIYGRWTADLIRVDFDSSRCVKGFGYLSALPGGAEKSEFITFVNDRLVKWTSLRRAIRTMYLEASPKAKSLFVYLAVWIPVNLVDYNVDPEKYLFSCRDETLMISEIGKVLTVYLKSDERSLITRVKASKRDIISPVIKGIQMIGAVDYGVFVCIKNDSDLGIVDIRDKLINTVTNAMATKTLVKNTIIDPPVKLDGPVHGFEFHEWVKIEDGFLKSVPSLSLT